VNETYVSLNGTLVNGNFLPGNYPDTFSLAANPHTDLAYAVGTNQGLSKAAVSIINLSKDEVVGTIPIAAGWPFADYLDAASNQLFVAQEGLGQVTVVNLTLGHVVANLTAGGSAGSSEAFALDGTTGDLILAGSYNGVGAGIFSSIDLANDSVLSTTVFGSNLDNVAFDSLTNEVAIEDTGTGNLSLFNATTLKYETSVAYPNVPSGVAVSPDGKALYLVSWTFGGHGALGNLTIVNATTDVVGRTLAFSGMPSQIALDPLNNTLYLATDSSTLVAVNMTSQTLVAAPPPIAGAYSIIFDSHGPELVGASLNNASAATGPGFANVTYIATGGVLGGLAVDPVAGIGYLSTPTPSGSRLNLTTFASAGKFYQYSGAPGTIPNSAPVAYAAQVGRLYVVANNGLIVDNATTGAKIAGFAYSCQDVGVTYDPESNQIFVANWCQPGGYITVLNASSDASVSTIHLGGGVNALGYDPATGDIWAQNNTPGGYSASLTEINGTSLTVTAYLPMLSPGVANTIFYDPAANAMIVGEGCSGCTGAVQEYNASSGAAVATYNVGGADMFGGTFLSGTNEVVLSNYAANNLTFFNATTFAVLGNVSVGSGPGAVEYDPANGNLLAANTYSGTISVLATGGSGGPYIESFSASPENGTRGTNFTLKVVAKSWSGGLSYTYSQLPPGCSSSNTASLSCIPTQSGDFRVKVTVTDGAGRSAYAIADLRVWSLYVVSFTATPGSIRVGQSTDFTTEVGDAGTWLSYAYSSLPPGCASANVSVLSCSPSSAGNYTVEVNVTSSSGLPASANTSLMVGPAPTPVITSFDAVPASIALGSSTSLTVAATPGSGASWLDLAYGNLPSGCASANVSTLPCAPRVTGSFNVTVTATNNLGGVSVANTTLVVTPALPPTITSFTADPVTIAFGNSTYFETVAQAGSGVPSYAYSSLPPGCSTSNTSALSCRPTGYGNYSITVTVTNSWGLSTHAQASLTVLTPPAPTITSFTASPAVLFLNQSTTLTVVAGGSNLHYFYTGLPDGCASTNASALDCRPTSSGNFTVNVSVSNPYGIGAHASLALEVIQPAPLRIASFVASPDTIVVGSTTQLTVTASGAAGAATYAYSDLPAGCASLNMSTLACTPTSAGNYTVTVQVTDVLGRSVSSSVKIEVTAAPSPPPPSNGGSQSNSLWTYVAVAAVVVVVLLIVGLLYARRRGGAGAQEKGSPAAGDSRSDTASPSEDPPTGEGGSS
jgi:hypothetical protein